MIEITYAGIFAFISLMWIVARVICGLKRHNVNWKYEVHYSQESGHVF